MKKNNWWNKFIDETIKANVSENPGVKKYNSNTIKNNTSTNIKQNWALSKLTTVTSKNDKCLYRTDQFKLKQGDTIKAQNGWVLNKWQKAYNSKFGKSVRDFLYGQDIKDLSSEEYFKKYGYNKPIGGIGTLGALIAPEWEGLEAPVVAENFGRAGYIKTIPQTARLKYTKPTNPSGFPKTQQLSNLDKFLQKSVQEQNDIVKYWNGERFSNLQQLQRNPQQYKLFQHWLNKQ